MENAISNSVATTKSQRKKLEPIQCETHQHHLFPFLFSSAKYLYHSHHWFSARFFKRRPTAVNSKITLATVILRRKRLTTAAFRGNQWNRFIRKGMQFCINKQRSLLSCNQKLPHIY